MMNGFMGGWGFIMFFIPLFIIGVIVFAVYQLNLENKNNITTNRRPEDILDERFVKGEITKEEYIQMKEILKK